MRHGSFGRFEFGFQDAALAATRLGKAALFGLTLVIGGATTQAQTLASLPSATQPIDRNGVAKPVAAWLDFCRRHADECAVNTAEPATVELTPATWNTIVSVNKRVNARIKPITDQLHWGIVDRWDFPDDGAGDCEDFQLLKRKVLVERGLPRRALRITVVIDDQGEGHAVLMVRTDRGDYILDNKTNAVLPWAQTGYVFVKREGQDSLAWVSLGGLTSPVTTANR
ncbi:MAG TPA: transglutaminase-like cysteine peptidase [Beijerinckiaceae bacterium]|jgi:predicted transglutaminase-like cysteine proteinase